MNSTCTRSRDKVWLIGHSCETITGARLPSGMDVMRSFMFYHKCKKMTISDSASHAYDQLIPFWLKSRLPIRQKPNIIRKIKDYFDEYVLLMKHRARSNDRDQVKQTEYTAKLQQLFDITHANAVKMIKNEEDRTFLKLQQQSRTGSIGSVDQKLAVREKRARERVDRQQQLAKLAQQATSSVSQQLQSTVTEDEGDSCHEAEKVDQEADSDDEFTMPERRTRKPSIKKQKLTYVITPSVAATLDRTNTSIRKSTMILASTVNEAGPSVSSIVLSKSSVHRHRQRCRKDAAQEIKDTFRATKSVVHWDGKLLPDITDTEASTVERLPVLLTSLADGSSKLLGVPKLRNGSGQAAADGVIEQLNFWNCESLVIGMCFDTTASNTGKFNGACSNIEKAIGRNLLRLACRHHMCEILLSDIFTICLGISSGPEIALFKRFRNMWLQLNHVPQLQDTPIIMATDTLKSFIHQQLQVMQPREDYRELLILSALMTGVEVGESINIRRPGAVHRARWMAKAIYSLKIEMLLASNESILQLTNRELHGIKRFNRFVVLVYIEAWFSCKIAADAPVNDLKLIQRLQSYADKELQTVGLKMVRRHAWYLTPELATLAIFSDLLSSIEKSQLVQNAVSERGSHNIAQLPQTLHDLRISRTFFNVTFLDDSFLELPVDTWPQSQSYLTASDLVERLPCVNDSAERGVALIQCFNATTKDENQKQYLLQVVERHRKEFTTCSRDDLSHI